jgi:hypothetical protein
MIQRPMIKHGSVMYDTARTWRRVHLMGHIFVGEVEKELNVELREVGLVDDRYHIV